MTFLHKNTNFGHLITFYIKKRNLPITQSIYLLKTLDLRYNILINGLTHVNRESIGLENSVEIILKDDYYKRYY